MTPASPETPGLCLRLFGPFDARVGGRALPPFRSRKGQGLLALLALRHGREVEREWLAGALWPDSPPEAALYNLRRNLSLLRGMLDREAGRLLTPTPRTLLLRLDGADVDVAAFDAAVKCGEIGALRKAVDLYSGPLLEGCCEEWVFGERERREGEWLGALEILARHALGRGESGEAADLLRRAVSISPLRETSQRMLMEALAGGGNAAAATRAYRDFRLLLLREIHAEPDPRTTELYHRIRKDSRTPSSEAVPDLKTLAAPNPELSLRPLPRPLTELLGRERETGEIRRLLVSQHLVTLTGVGGVGKTRLALHVAGEESSEYPDGAVFVDLSPITDPDRVPELIASALGLPEMGKRRDSSAPGAAPPSVISLTVPEELSEHLRHRSMLLVLDNFEGVIGAAAVVAELVAASPRSSCLVTSREALRLTGEQEYEVMPLPLPDLSRRTSTDDLRGHPAVELFIRRARSVKPDLSLTPESVRTAAEICVRLDGLPLAIELAAARVKLFSLPALLARLDERLPLLTDGPRDAPARHRTLRAALAWSYDLLEDAERTLFRRLSVFAGGATLKAMERVCISDAEGEITALEGLSSLTGKSLVRPAVSDEEPRFTMLETLREFAREKLKESGEEPEIRQRHAAYYKDLSKEMDARMGGEGQVEALDRLEAEHENLRAALAWDMGREHGLSDALMFAWHLRGFWHVRGHFGEERRWLEAALARSSDGHGRGCVLQWAVRVYTRACDFTAALDIYEEQLSSAREAGNVNWQAHVLIGIGKLEERRGNTALARARYREALRHFSDVGKEGEIARAHQCLGTLALKSGAWDEARRHFETSLAVYRSATDRRPLTDVQFGLARAAVGTGDARDARLRYREGLRLAGELGYRTRIVEGLEGLAALEADSRRFDRASRLSGAAASLREGMEESPLHLLSSEEAEFTVHRARAALGEEQFTLAWEEGRGMEPEAALTCALEENGEIGDETDLSLSPIPFSALLQNA